MVTLVDPFRSLGSLEMQLPGGMQSETSVQDRECEAWGFGNVLRRLCCVLGLSSAVSKYRTNFRNLTACDENQINGQFWVTILHISLTHLSQMHPGHSAIIAWT